MADNKKTKVDFATALREAADKIAPAKEKKSSKREESLIVDVSGTPTTLFRGDMTDEAWADLKAKADAKTIRPLPPKTYTAADQGTPEEFQNPFPDRAATAGDNGPGMSVLGNVAEMVKGATPGQDAVSQAAASEGADVTPVPTPEEQASADVYNKPTFMGSQLLGAMKNVATGETPLSEVPIVKGAQWVNKTLTPVAPQSEASLAVEQDLAAPAKAPAQTAQAMLAPAPAPVDRGPSMSAGTPLPGNVGLPNIAGDMKAMNDAADVQAAAILRKGDLESQQQKQKAELLQQQQDEELKLQARSAIAATAHAERMKQGEDAMVNLQTHLQQLERERPDPNRYWNNKDAGQKAMAVIAGALFGATGQGMAWLNRLDGLVRDDVQLQMADLQRREGLVGKQIGVQNNLIAMAKERGMNDQEAISAARASMKESFARQLEMAAANSGSESVKQDAIIKAAQVRQSSAKDSIDLKFKTQAAAVSSAQLGISKYNAETSRMEAVQKMQGTGQGKPVTDAVAEKAASLMTAISTAEGMSKQFKEKASGLLAKASRYIPGTDAAEYASDRLSAVQMIGFIFEGGKLAEGDMKKYSDMIPEPGDQNGAVKWAKLVSTLKTDLANKLGALKATGHNTAGLEQQAAQSAKTPIQFKATGGK